jgi:ATP-binding cassette subfamily B protein
MMKVNREQRTVLRLIGLARQEWVGLSIGLFFLVIGGGLGLLYPKALSLMIDRMNSEGAKFLENWTLTQIVTVAVIMILVQSIATMLRYYMFTMVGERIVSKLRSDLYAAMMRQEIGFFDANRTGDLTSRLASDASVIQNTVSVNISMALRFAFLAVGSVAAMVWTSAKLSLVMLAVVPPILVFTMIFGKRISRFSRTFQDAIAKAGEVAEETLSGVRTVRSFARESNEVQRYQERIQSALATAQRRTLETGVFQAILSVAIFSSIALVLWAGGREVMADRISIGNLAAFLIYVVTAASSILALAETYSSFMSAAGATGRVFELLDRKPEVANEKGATLPHVAGQIGFDRVSFAYPTRPDHPALQDLSFNIEPGEVVALVGPSGSGKSTIASLLARFYDPTSGTIHLDGERLRDLDTEWLRRQIGVVSQEPILFSTNIAENIRYGAPQADMEAVEEAARQANAASFIEGFPEGYQTEVGERGIQLSGGQKQRVAIARALLKDPRILVLDEATSALDTESEALVKEALERLMRGRTTIIIAHRLSTVKDADRVLVIEKGQVVQQGAHRELLEDESGTYRRLVEHQFA